MCASARMEDYICHMGKQCPYKDHREKIQAGTTQAQPTMRQPRFDVDVTTHTTDAGTSNANSKLPEQTTPQRTQPNSTHKNKANTPPAPGSVLWTSAQRQQGPGHWANPGVITSLLQRSTLSTGLNASAQPTAQGRNINDKEWPLPSSTSKSPLK